MKEYCQFQLAPHPDHNALYIHIPFCRVKCRYCDFYSLAGRSAEEMERVIEGIIRELAWFQEKLLLTEIDTVYIGGGTPSILPPKLFRTLLKCVSRLSHKKPAEWTVEANPESIDEDFIGACCEGGVTRISLGIQCLQDHLLRVLGRSGSAAKNREALNLLASLWPGDISIDLISGIPLQKPADIQDDLETALAVKPAHVSLYSLCLEKGTVLAGQVARREYAMPSPEEEEELWSAASGKLEASGYGRYEVSNFALPQKECCHNLAYWRLNPYIGVGPAAVSTLPGANGEILRLENPRDAERFFKEDPEHYLAIEKIDAKTFLLEQLLMGLRLSEGIERTEIVGRFTKPLEALVPGLWEDWLRQGLARNSRTHYACTPGGRNILNRLLKQAAEAIENIGQLAVRWP